MLLSLVLVLVASITLVLGVLQDGLVLIYVSIATCVAAVAALGVAVLLHARRSTDLPQAHGPSVPR